MVWFSINFILQHITIICFIVWSTLNEIGIPTVNNIIHWILYLRYFFFLHNLKYNIIFIIKLYSSNQISNRIIKINGIFIFVFNFIQQFMYFLIYLHLNVNNNNNILFMPMCMTNLNHRKKQKIKKITQNHLRFPRDNL